MNDFTLGYLQALKDVRKEIVKYAFSSVEYAAVLRVEEEFKSDNSGVNNV